MKDGPPVLLHCGLSWSDRSNRVAKELTKWSEEKGLFWSQSSRDVLAKAKGPGLLCAFVDIDRTPRFINERHIKGVPTVLLLRNGRVEQRADSVDVNSLKPILRAAEAYAPSEFGVLNAEQALSAAEELLQKGEPAEPLFQRALGDDAPIGPGGKSVLAFRARLGLLKCAVKEVETEVELLKSQGVDGTFRVNPLTARKLKNAFDELKMNHEENLPTSVLSVRPDSSELMKLKARVELLIDALFPEYDSCEDEKEVLQSYLKGDEKAAITSALNWYRQSAGGDIAGLIEAYCQPARYLPDRPNRIPSLSIYSDNGPLASNLDEAPGPARARAMLRQLFDACGPSEGPVVEALQELEFMLDRDKWIPFFTRRPYRRRGGPPRWGRGTGKRSGYSRRYWIEWGPDRDYKNSRPMGSPHCDPKLPLLPPRATVGEGAQRPARCTRLDVTFARRGVAARRE